MTSTQPTQATTARTTSAARWMGVGRSNATDAATAGSIAAAEALRDRTAVVVMVFAAHTYDFPALLRPIQSQLAPGATLLGCSTNGHFALPGDDRQDVDAGVVVLGLGGDGLEATATLEREVSTRRRDAGALAARVVQDLTLEHRVCLLLADGLTREQHEIVRGSYAALGAMIPTVGGCSGDDITYTQTFQFLGDRDHVEVVSDGLIGLGLASAGPIGIGIDHGWSKQGRPFLVTNSAGGHVYELDNRPALDVYLEGLQLDRHVAEDAEAFRAIAFEHPLGLSRRTGEDIRVVHGADICDGSLTCLADVPQGAIAWQMSTTHLDLIGAAVGSRDQALEGLGGAEPIGLVAFDCGARKVMLGADGIADELQALHGGTDIPVAGFYTYGEFARTQGSRGMHHLTLVSVALS